MANLSNDEFEREIVRQIAASHESLRKLVAIAPQPATHCEVCGEDWGEPGPLLTLSSNGGMLVTCSVDCIVRWHLATLAQEMIPRLLNELLQGYGVQPPQGGRRDN